MAIYKLQPSTPQPIGSLGGATFQRLGNSFAIRMHNKPVDKQRNGQKNLRQMFAANSSKWRDLNPTQQDSFIDEAPNYPKENSLGDPYDISGFNLMQSSNQILVSNNQNEISSIPSAPSYPSGAILTMNFEYLSQVLSIAALVTTIPANFIWQLWGSKPSPIIALNPNADFTHIHTYTPGQEPGTINIFAAFQNQYGLSSNYINKYFHVRVRMISLATGQHDNFAFGTVLVSNS